MSVLSVVFHRGGKLAVVKTVDGLRLPSSDEFNKYFATIESEEIDVAGVVAIHVKKATGSIPDDWDWVSAAHFQGVAPGFSADVVSSALG